MIPKRGLAAPLLVLVLGLCCPVSTRAEGPLTEGELIAKNIRSAGGLERLETVKMISFKTRYSSYFAGSDGRMKVMITGMGPVVMEAVCVDAAAVRRNRLNAVAEVTGMEKARLQLMARLLGGCFTLKNFQGQLKLAGKKNYGTQAFYVLSASRPELTAEFYLDDKEFTLQRVFLKGTGAEGARESFNYDVGPLAEVQGVKFPSSWFLSEVGAQGSTVEVSGLVVNPSLPPDFLDRLEVNAGQVEVQAGSLRGNVLNIIPVSPAILAVLTNWAPEAVTRAGLQNGDRLDFLYAGESTEIAFYADEMQASKGNAFVAGSAMMSTDPPAMTTFYILFYQFPPDRIKALTGQFTALMPIQVKKKESLRSQP